MSSYTLRRVAIAGAITLGIVSIAATSVVTLRSPHLTRSDFTFDYVSARAWADGGNPYAVNRSLVDRYVGKDVPYWSDAARRRNPHTPALILVFAPLAQLPFRAARAVWLGFNVTLLFLCVFVVARRIGFALWTATGLGSACFALPFVFKELRLGQTNVLALALLVAAWLAVERSRETGAGVSLGAAAALKVHPALAGVALLRGRRFRSVAWLVTSAAGLLGFAVLAMGSRATRDLVTAQAGDFELYRVAPHSISLVALPYKWLGTPGAEASVAASVLSLCAFAFCAALAVRTPARYSGSTFWAMAPLMVLISPLSWHFSCVIVIPTFLLMLRRDLRGSARPSIPLMLGALLIAIGAPPGLRDDGLVQEMFGFNLPTYGLLVLALLEWSSRHNPDAASA